MLIEHVLPVTEVVLCIVLMVMALVVVYCVRLMSEPNGCCMSCGITYCPKCAAMLVDDAEGQ